MRVKNKMTRERNRVVKAAHAVKKSEVLFFTVDQQVSGRILAVLSKRVSKEKVQVTERVPDGKKVITRGNKTFEVTKYKRIPKAEYNTVEMYRVICGSNGKTGTWFNTVKYSKDHKVLANTVVGKVLTNEEFLQMFPEQSNVFKAIFAEEFMKLSKPKNNGK